MQANATLYLERNQQSRAMQSTASVTGWVQIPPAPPYKPLIFLEKFRGFSLGVEK